MDVWMTSTCLMRIPEHSSLGLHWGSRRHCVYRESYGIPEHSSLGLHWGKYLCRQNGWQKNIPEHSSLGLHWGRTLSAKLAEEGYIPEHSSLGLHWGWRSCPPKRASKYSWAFKLRTSLRTRAMRPSRHRSEIPEHSSLGLQWGTSSTTTFSTTMLFLSIQA